mmetsp:Transcript_15238/g.34616  ORF Transcript_15238/g.34616 Transcript_15238/m.34616 type:complete len:103 (+) Transcript_15238:146-454(+)
MLEAVAYQFLDRKRRPAIGRGRIATGSVGFRSGDVVETPNDAAAAMRRAEREIHILECDRQLLLHDPEEFVSAAPPSPGVFMVRGSTRPAPGRSRSTEFRRF